MKRFSFIPVVASGLIYLAFTGLAENTVDSINSDAKKSFSAVRVIGRDSIREYFREGDYAQRVYYRFLDPARGEEKEIISYAKTPFGIAYPANSDYDDSQHNPREVVLKPGQEIRFENQNGSGFISYVSKVKRHYEITQSRYSFAEDLRKTVKMIIRRMRFLGERGLYEPASRWGFEFWAGPRMVVSEAELHFDSEETALKYLKVGINPNRWVYNNQGYVVGYFETPDRGKQINVTLYRYYINGKPALNMPGFDNSKVVLMKDEESKSKDS